jgi:hypothetical protein
VNTAVGTAVRALRPDLYKDFNPWDRVCELESLRSLMAEAGVTPQDVVVERGTHPLRAPADWWRMVLGTGYRGTVEQLDAMSREVVRRENLNFIRESGVTSVEANVIYAVATRPEASDRGYAS